jgi:hypothetical protein
MLPRLVEIALDGVTNGRGRLREIDRWQARGFPQAEGEQGSRHHSQHDDSRHDPRPAPALWWAEDDIGIVHHLDTHPPRFHGNLAV